MDAHFLRGLLEQEGIAAVVQGEALEGAWGNLPVSARSMPSVWVNEEDVARAEPVVAEYVEHEKEHARLPQSTQDTPRATWKCPKCGEDVEEQFDECWNCGSEKPGTTLP